MVTGMIMTAGIGIGVGTVAITGRRRRPIMARRLGITRPRRFIMHRRRSITGRRSLPSGSSHERRRGRDALALKVSD
jgi:hypothetical protein